MPTKYERAKAAAEAAKKRAAVDDATGVTNAELVAANVTKEFTVDGGTTWMSEEEFQKFVDARPGEMIRYESRTVDG